MTRRPPLPLIATLAAAFLMPAAGPDLPFPWAAALADDDDGGDDDDDRPRRQLRDDDDDDDDRRPGRPAPRSDDDDDGAGSDDDDDGIGDDDPEYRRYEGPDGPRRLREDEIVDRDGALARRAEIAAFDADPAALRRARRLGFTIVDSIALEGLGSTITILRAPRGLTVRDSLARLRAGDSRTTYDYNHYYSYRPTSAAKAMAVRELPRRTPLTERDDILIGLIDARVDIAHEAFRSSRIETRQFSAGGRDAGTDHGTSVAGLLVGQTGGLAPRAQLYAASVFSPSLNGDSVTAALELVRALDWMIENRVTVINMSLAGPDNAVLRAAVARAVKRGHIIVAAVGNDGPNAKPLYPASYDGVVGVTAVDAQKRVYRRAARGGQVDLAAPGVDVVSAAGTGYASHTGTSFAAPHIAAALAAHDGEPGAALEALIATAEDLGTAGRDDTYGHGLVPPAAQDLPENLP